MPVFKVEYQTLAVVKGVQFIAADNLEAARARVKQTVDNLDVDVCAGWSIDTVDGELPEPGKGAERVTAEFYDSAYNVEISEYPAKVAGEVNVCIVGNPAIDGVCGDPDCHCASGAV